MRFAEGLFRHRLLALVLLSAGLALFVAFELVQPRAYSSGASLWVDSTGPGSAQYSSNGFPAGALQNDLQELLSTGSFELAVAQDGPLAAYLAGHPYALGTGLKAIPGLRSLFGSMGSVNDEVTTYLPDMVSLTAAGTNVLNITVSAPSPNVAVGTVKALIHEYTAQVTEAQAASDQVTVTYDEREVTQAKAALQQAEDQLSAYMSTHPAAANSGGGSFDATGIELNQAVSAATSSYNAAVTQYQGAQISLADVANQAGFNVIDAPTGAARTSIKGKLLEMGFVGLLVGAVIDFLVVAIILGLDRTARGARDVRRALGTEVAAEIEFVGYGLSHAPGAAK